jgi:hypothetical protein
MTTSGFEPDGLDRLLSEEPTIVVKQWADCNNLTQHPQYYVVSGPCLTYRYVLHELSQQRFCLQCTHLSFENFVKKTDVQFDFCCA